VRISPVIFKHHVLIRVLRIMEEKVDSIVDGG